jgi:tRNA(adenine34) deaminase
MQSPLENETNDELWMREALAEAAAADTAGEVPVGAVAVLYGQIVGRGRNAREGARDPTAHAEIAALREAANALGRWRLSGVTLYVTLEPCAMCAGAMVLGRIDRLVYAAKDPKAGAAGSVYNLVDDARLNHRMAVRSGVLEPESAQLLRSFFEKRRDRES